VLVSNAGGSINSSNATLTVNPSPSVVLIPSQTATSGIVSLPIILLSQATENTLQFSLTFDPSLLSFTGVTLGGSVSNGYLITNINQIASGKLGLLISLPSDASFAAGTQELARVNFLLPPLASTNVSTIAFGDVPTIRQVSTPLPSLLTATYVGGNVTIPPMGTEGDVFPVSSGDGSVAGVDLVQMGRFVAGLDTITNAVEFQRADCAPRATLGDGLLTVADWVQAGRYAASLDPLVAAGGPTQPQTTALSPSPGKDDVGRTLIASSIGAQAGQSCQVPILLSAQGNENGVEFSLAFNPTALSYVSTAVGADANGASLRVNASSVASGKVGIVMTLPTGSTFANATQQVAVVNFNVASAAGGSSPVAFAAKPLPQQIASATAQVLATSYANGVVAVTPIARPVIQAGPPGGNLTLTWPASATGFVLEGTSSLTSPAWTTVSATLVTNGVTQQVSATIPAADGQKFFRLRHP
jgi:Cohesin domain